MEFTSVFARSAGLLSVSDSAGRPDAGERALLPDEPVGVALEGARGGADAAGDDSPDAVSGTAPAGEFFSVPRRATSRSKSLTYRTLDLRRDASGSCVAQEARAVIAASAPGPGCTREPNKRSSKTREKSFMG